MQERVRHARIGRAAAQRDAPLGLDRAVRRERPDRLRAAGRALGLPCAPILERSRATIAQFDLDRTTRATNVRGAFALRDRADRPGRAHLAGGAPPSPNPLAGRWIVLVDDVVTTGATLSACAEPLLDAGAIGVSAITVARER